MRRTLAHLFCTAAMMVASVAVAADAPSFVPTANNEAPMYGNLPKNAAQKAADEKFIAQAVALKGSKEAAADESAKLGFQYLMEKHDPATAMKRFNQTYLLDPDNGSGYQGMAITTLMRTPTATAQAEDLFKHAVNAKRTNPAIFADYGRFLLMQQRPADAVPVLKRGVAADASYVETNSLLAAALYESNQKAEACPLAKKWQAAAQPQLAEKLGAILADPACKSAT